MFRCANCKNITPPGTPQEKMVTETREKTYTHQTGRGTKQTQGLEIVKEVGVCPPCFLTMGGH